MGGRRPDWQHWDNLIGRVKEARDGIKRQQAGDGMRLPPQGESVRAFSHRESPRVGFTLHAEAL